MKSLKLSLIALISALTSLSASAWATTNLPFGQTTTGTISTAGQINYYSFTANAGDIVDFTIITTSGKLSPALQLFNPGGTVIASANTDQLYCGSADTEMNSVSLPTAGSYTLAVSDCAGTNIGGYNIYSQRTDNPTGPVALTLGQAQGGSISLEAQSNTYSFSAIADDVVDFTLHITQGSLSPKITLYNPNGSYNNGANTDQLYCGSADTEMNTVTLPTTGNYTVLVGDCSDSNTGNYEIYSQRTNNPTGPVALTFGQAQSGSISLEAQSDTYTFSANSGDVVDFTLHTTQGSLSPKITLYNPNGSYNNSANTDQLYCGNADTELNTVTLPTTGTYTVLVGDCSDSNTGSYEIYSQRTDDPTGLTLTFGQAQSGSISLEAQSTTYTFSASAGDVVDFTLHTTQGSLSPKITLYNPNGSYNNGANTDQLYCGSADTEMNTVTLPTTGTYTVLVGDCSDSNTGSYEIYSQRTNNPTGPVALTFGQAQSGSISLETQSATYTFSANAGDVVDFTLHTTLGTLSPKITLHNPNGSNNKSANTDQLYCGSADTEMNAVALPTTGPYTVLVGDCSDSITGSYEIYSQRTNNPTNPTSILWGQTQTSNIGSVAYSDTYTFSGTDGESVNLKAVETSGTLSPKITVYNPDGSYLTSVNTDQLYCGNTSASLTSVALGQTGNYTVLVGDCLDSDTGGYSLQTQCFSNCPLPEPILTSISPTSVLVGSGSLTLTVNGTNFVNVDASSVVEWNGVPLTTTWVSTTQITAAVPASATMTAGCYPVTVFTPAPGGGTSSPIQFCVDNPQPTTTSLSPASQTAPSGAFTLTVNGTNFIPSSSVQWNGIGLVTTYVSATEVQAAVPASDCASGGMDTVTVFNPTPGGGASNSQTFTCNNPVPTTTSPLSPANQIAPSGAFTLTVTGTNFVPSSTVQWNSANLVTTYVSATEVQAAVPASDCANGGTDSVAVFNPTPSGGTSNSQTFTCNNPVPTTTSPLSPASAFAGSAAFTLTVNGTDFVPSSQVQWNGSGLVTTYLSATGLQATVPALDIQSAGTASVTVFNPVPSGGTSAPLTFTINNPLPATTSLSPASVAWGGTGFTLTVNGSNFVQSSTVNWNGSGLPTTYVSATQLQATVPAADCTAVGTDQVTVTSPAPGGGTSSPALTFSCVNPVPVTTSPLSPASVLAGSSAFMLTVNGSNFIPSATVLWKGVALSTAYVSSTRLTATVPASDLGNAGYFAITVVNAPPGGGTSNAQTFLVDNPPAITTSLSPTVVDVGSAFTLTVNGSNFVQNSTVRWNGTALATTYVSATEVQAAVPATDTATAGTAEVTVINPTPGGGTSSPALPVAVEGPQPVLTSPTCGSVLPAGGVTFNWTASYGATAYGLWLGLSGPGSSSLYSSGSTTATSATVASLPARAATVYARLFWVVGGKTQYNDCTYTEAGAPATMISPAPGKTLGTSDVTFTWTAGYGVTAYGLWLGLSGPGSSSLYNSGSTTAISVIVTSLPAKGATVYARLFSVIDGVTQYNDYTYTEASTPAMMSSPAPGGTLGTTNVKFTWTAGYGVTEYGLWLGLSGPGSSSLYSSGATTATSVTVPSLPAIGATVYARLFSVIDGVTQYNDYTYTEAPAGTPATMISPAQGNTLGTSNVMFTWTTGTGVTQYNFLLGLSGPGSGSLYNSGWSTSTSVTVPKVPAHGATVYARLYSDVNGVSQYIDYTYTEQ